MFNKRRKSTYSGSVPILCFKCIKQSHRGEQRVASRSFSFLPLFSWIPNRRVHSQLHVWRLLKTIVNKLESNSSLLNTPHKLFPIKGHTQSAHLFQGNVAISHERNTWILMKFVIAAKPHHLTSCIQSGDLWPCSGALAARILTFCLCVKALGCRPREAYQDLIVIGKRMEAVIKCGLESRTLGWLA